MLQLSPAALFPALPPAELLGDGGSSSAADSSAMGALRSRFAALRRRLADSTLEDFQIYINTGGRGRPCMGG